MPPLIQRTISRDGVRRVKPYTHVFKAHAKRRWLGRAIAEVMACEFPAQATPSYLRGAMADGRILVNSRPCVPGAVFRDGDVLEHRMTRTEPPVRAPLAHEWIILLTNELLVINKPSTVPVHSAGRFQHNTVVAILADECEELRAAGREGLFIVHRLDRETSGLLILARTAQTARELAAHFRDGRISKRYLALVDGIFPEGVHIVDAPLHREVRAGVGTNTVSPAGKPAVTEFVRLSVDTGSNTSVVLCSPQQGRTHQIRLHLSWLGYPIANDALYGGSNCAAGSHNLLFASADAPSLERDRQQAGGGDGGGQSAGGGDGEGGREEPAVAEGEEEGGAAELLESAMIFLHAIDYKLDGAGASAGEEGAAWHYCAPLPPWALHIAPEAIGGGYAPPAIPHTAAPTTGPATQPEPERLSPYGADGGPSRP